MTDTQLAWSYPPTDSKKRRRGRSLSLYHFATRLAQVSQFEGVTVTEREQVV